VSNERDGRGGRGGGGLDRRAFLRGGALAGAAGVAGAGLAGRGHDASAAPAADPDAGAAAGALRDRIPFDGRRQAGIATAPAEQATFVALDAIAPDRAALVAALQQLSAQARSLCTGYAFAVRDRSDPPPDSGTLGATVAPDALTVTIAFGASVFDERYGLASARPPGLVTMPRFPGDEIDPDRAHGDVLLTLNANRRDTVLHALRELLRPVRGAFAVRWTLDGFVSADRGPSPRAARRNLFGFRDGTANPDGAELERLVWLPDDGTFQVVRTIRQHVEFWDRVGLLEQEQMIGRRRDSGAPLGGDAEAQDPRYELDPKGVRIPLDAHIRLANPRTAATDGQRILRRAFNYHRGVDAGGQLDDGLVFVAYNQDIERQFATIQNRLAGEPMTDYVTPVGGGYFYVPRGARGGNDWVGSTLLGS
jgi:deferrochelatase/peroxidase EfeB